MIVSNSIKALIINFNFKKTILTFIAGIVFLTNVPAQRLTYGVSAQLFNYQSLKASQSYIYSPNSYRLFIVENKFQSRATLWSGYLGLGFKAEFNSLVFNLEPLFGFVTNNYSVYYPVSADKNLECFSTFYTFDFEIPISLQYVIPGKRKHKFYIESGAAISIPWYSWDMYNVYDAEKEVYAVGDKDVMKGVLYDEKVNLNSVWGIGFRTSLLNYGLRYYKRLTKIEGQRQSINNITLYLHLVLTSRKAQKHYLNLN